MTGLNLRWRYKKRWHVSCPDHTPPAEEWDTMAERHISGEWVFTDEACEVCGRGGRNTEQGWKVPEENRRDASTTSRLVRRLRYD